MNKEYKDIEGKVQPKKKFAFSKKKAANIPESNPSSQDSNVKNQPSIQKEAKRLYLKNSIVKCAIYHSKICNSASTSYHLDHS